MDIKTRDIPTFENMEAGVDVLSAEQQTIIAELSIMNWSFLSQLRMPMVIDGTGKKHLLMFFQNCDAALLVTLIRAELISKEFYSEHEGMLDADYGIKRGVVMSCIEVYQLAYDIQYMLGLYLAAMGLDDEKVPRYNKYYHNAEYFDPARWR